MIIAYNEKEEAIEYFLKILIATLLYKVGLSVMLLHLP